MSNDMTIEELKKMIATKEAEVKDGETVKWVHSTVDGKGNPKITGCRENTECLLKHYNVTVRYNEMSKDIEINIPNESFIVDKVANASIDRIADLARKNNYNPDVAVQNVQQIAATNAYHPVRDWILDVEWDGKSRVGEIFNTLTLSPDMDKPFVLSLFVKWMTSAVASVMYGTEHQNDDHNREGFLGTEGVFVLQGDQGISKTSWLTSLVPVGQRWFDGGAYLDPKNKDIIQKVVSRWLVELGELDTTFKEAEHASLKAFLTLRTDRLRPAYARTADEYPRRTVFCASVNKPEVLKYDDESRRYWMVAVEAVDAKHGIDVQQLWAEVYKEYYLKCFPYWLNADERQTLYKQNQQFFTVKSDTVERLDRYVAVPSDVPKREGEWVEASKILECIGSKEKFYHASRDLAAWAKQQGVKKRSKPTNQYFVHIDVGGVKHIPTVTDTMKNMLLD